VVDGADELLVTLPDKREFKARIVGTDRRTDVAVVKIEASGLNAVRIGDVNRLRVGEWVMAIGSPFGLENTVTAGIVSAKKRDTGDFLPFIQTDVAINPGNSGGPLINMRGEVVGINSQIYSRSGGFQGISFAIPIDEAMRVADQLRANGRVTRGRIGVQIDQVSKEVAESIGLGRQRGALVRAVEPDSPAAKAGVEPGDIIIRFDGKEIEKSVDLPRMVGNTRPGSRSIMTVFRRGAQKELAVTVAELEPERVERRAAAPDTPRPAATLNAQALGLTLVELTPAQKKELNLTSGVRVQAAEGPAARAGLRDGDVILSIANTETPGLKEFDAVVARLDKLKPVNVLFRRGDWVQYVVIRPAR
jgi:serine protease Do